MGFLVRLKGWLIRKRNGFIIARARKQLHVKGFSIISQNCIGGVFYHDMGMQFLSPTINTFIPEPGFVKLVLNLRHYMEQELVVHWGETYPIGMLEDVEIHFMHYGTCQEAEESWNKRKARINWDRIFVIGTDRNGFHESVFAEWIKIPYPKILYTAQERFAADVDSIYFPEYRGSGFVQNLIPNREFYKDGKLVDKINGLRC